MKTFEELEKLLKMVANTKTVNGLPIKDNPEEVREHAQHVKNLEDLLEESYAAVNIGVVKMKYIRQYEHLYKKLIK